MRKTILSLALSGVLLSGWASDRVLITDDYSNYFSTAKEIPLNMEISGSIETAGDIDIFKFNLNQDDGVSVKLKTLSENSINIYVLEKETIETLSQYLNEENWDIRGDVKFNIKNILEFSNSSYQEESVRTLNMNSGDYYIVIFCYGDSLTTPYTFRIESEENNGSVSLDPITLEYCKTHLSECGIEVQKDSSLKYTENDLEAAKAAAKEEGKIEGEAAAKNELKLSKDRIDSLGSGWSLVGSSQATEDNTIFNSASSVWVYDNGSWDNNPSEIKAFSGFWIKK